LQGLATFGCATKKNGERPSKDRVAESEGGREGGRERERESVCVRMTISHRLEWQNVSKSEWQNDKWSCRVAVSKCGGTNTQANDAAGAATRTLCPHNVTN
jgi:hypothetical protein